MTSCRSKQLLRRTALIVPALIGVVAPIAGASLDRDRTIRAFHVGNSVTDTITYTAFRTMVQAPGNTYTYGRHTISGTPLSGIWANPNRGFTTAPFGSYANGLPNYEWDVVTLQPFDRMMFGFADSDLYAARQFMDLTLTNPANADTQFYIYSRWPRREEITNPDGTKSYPAFDYQRMWDRSYTHLNWGNTYETRNTNETRDYFNRLLGMVRTEYPTLQKQPLMVPVGDVLYELDQRLRTGTIPELPDVSGMYVDAIHFGDLGRFVVGTTYYSTMYEAPAHGLSSASYRSTQAHPGQAARLDVTDPRFVALVQDVVWDVVRQHPHAIGGAPMFSVNYDGPWNDSWYWTRAQVPNQPTDVARLANYNTARRTVRLDEDVHVERIEVDSPNGYNLSGPGTLTLTAATDAQAITLSARSTDMTIATSVRVSNDFRTQYASARTLTISDTLRVDANYTHNGGTVKAGTLDVAGTVLITRGQVRLTGETAGVAAELWIAKDASLDIGTAGFVVNYSADDASPLDRFLADIAAGRVVSQPAGVPESPHAIVVAIDTATSPVASYNGRDVDATSVLLTRVLQGDATLDGLVDFNDLVALASHFDDVLSSWTAGDVTRDGVVDASDLDLVAQSYGMSMQADGSALIDPNLQGRFDADWSLAQALTVPEPAALLIGGGLGIALLSRRR